MSVSPFRPCLILPVYDPGPALGRTVAALAGHGLPLYLVDDGSGPDTRQELQRLAAAEPLVRLLSMGRNQGKGAAVMLGLRRAALDGFSHGFQVDSDGQHDASAVPAFLALAQAHPEAVIAGTPCFDHSVPNARKYGRLFSHLWVGINTLSMTIHDSLCGFRVYPLEATVALMDRTAIGRRMTFDTEIVVRLHWAGVPVLNAPVQVTYPADGVSHFQPWADTLRLVGLHARLLPGMLRHSPGLLLRKLAPAAPAAGGAASHIPWYRIRERGTLLGFRIMLGLLRLVGPRAVRVVADGVLVPYFFVTSRRARQASRAYLARLRAQSGPLPGLPGEPGPGAVFRHFRSFTRSTVDKVLAWSGCHSGIELDPADLEAFMAQRAGGRGTLFLGAHLGNLEMLRALGRGQGLTGLNAVIYGRNAARFHEILELVNPGFAADLMRVEQVTPDTAIRMQQKLERGECLFIIADRPAPRTPDQAEGSNQRTVQVPFLGAPAAFPCGPYFLAHLLRCPVYLVHCVYDGTRYRVRLEPFAERIELPRAGRQAAMAEWAARYARSLEAQCRATPFQWFNFFDFWAER
jgi:predicted LPLAT superfamily acyltransferase